MIGHSAELLKHDKAGDPIHGLKWDAEDNSQGRPATLEVEYPYQRQHRGTVIERDGILLARQPKDLGVWQ